VLKPTATHRAPFHARLEHLLGKAPVEVVKLRKFVVFRMEFVPVVKIPSPPPIK
jgi:hypothetical protein